MDNRIITEQIMISVRVIREDLDKLEAAINDATKSSSGTWMIVWAMCCDINHVTAALEARAEGAIRFSAECR